MKIIDINGRERECVRAYFNHSWPGYVTVEFESKRRKGYKHTEWMPIDDFFAHNPSLKNTITTQGLPPKRPLQLAGQVTSALKDSLTDTTQNWDPNSYAGMYCWISRGKGEGQVRIILKNTKSRVVVDKPWDTRPNHTSQYSLLYHRPTTPAQGNTLAIEEIRKLEEKARQMDLEAGRPPAPRQYTTEKQSA